MSPTPGYVKKWIAGIFLAAFLFIHAGKLFHSHPCTGSDSHHHLVITKAAATACAICEFQLTRDALLPDQDTKTEATVFYNPEFVPFNAPLIAAHTASLPGRGPPALL